MNSDSLWHRMKKNQFFSLIGGFAIAAAAIGILVLVVSLWIEPMSTPERAGTIQFHVDQFTLWYQKHSAGIAGHAALSRELQGDLGDLIKLLNVDPSLIPDPIDVFVHDSIPAMQASIAKRKNPKSRGYTAPLDLLAGESPRRRLAELVLAFGWGQCGSRLMKEGVALYASDPRRNFHAVVAALPQRLYLPLPELILMADRGKFPESIYEQFDSPYSPASIAFANLHSLFNLSVQGKVSPQNIPALEAASLVQFLIETKKGIGSVKQAWGTGNTQKLLACIDKTSITDLASSWYAAAKEEGRTADDYEYLRVYYLLGNGDPDAAWTLAQELAAKDPSDANLLLAGRCAISVGAFDRARDIVERITDKEKKQELQGYIDLYAGWSVSEAAGLRFFISPQIAAGEKEGLVSQTGQAYARIVDQLGLDGSELPQPMTIFVYGDAETRNRGAGLIPLLPTQNGTLHVVATDDVAYMIAETLPAYVWGKRTYSRLLRSGLAVALSRSEAQLVQQGCALRLDGSWVPLGQIDFGVADEETVKVEAGLMLRYLLDESVQDVRKVWIATSPLDLYLSVDTALDRVFGRTREQIEEVLVSSVLLCK